MAKLLLTGATGFLARHLIPVLKQAGYTLLGTGTRPYDQVQARLQGVLNPEEYQPLDLNDIDQVQALVQGFQPEYVIHLAALSFVAHPRPLEFYQVNVLGSENLLQALKLQQQAQQRQNGGLGHIKKVLLASSATVYGKNATGCISENTIPIPQNHYGCSKLAMESLASNYETDFPVLNLRLFNFTGPGQAEHFLLPKLVKHFAEQSECIHLGNLDVSRDFSDVRDIAKGCLLLLQQEGITGKVNLSSGCATPLNEVLAVLEKITGHKPDIIGDQNLMRANEIKQLWGDNQYLKQLTQWQPEYSLEQTLAWMLTERTLENRRKTN